jgi:hypothetical protein
MLECQVGPLKDHAMSVNYEHSRFHGKDRLVEIYPGCWTSATGRIAFPQLASTKMIRALTRGRD